MLHKICNHGNTFVYEGLREGKCSGWGHKIGGTKAKPQRR